MKEAGLSFIKAVSDHFFPKLRDTPELAGPSQASFCTWKQLLLPIRAVT
jgi:hypothetical protein